MKTAFISNSPLKILNTINMVINNVENTSGTTDVFVEMIFKNAEEICNKLEETKLFNKVIRCYKKNIKLDKFTDLLGYKKILSIYDFSDNSFKTNKYDQLFVGDRSLLGVALSYMNKPNVFIYDDGIITYSGNCIVNEKTYKYPFLNKLFKTDVFSFNIKKLYVNNKEFCRSTISENIEQLPLLNNDNKALPIIKDIFKYNENSLLRNHDLLILEQPIEEKQNYNGVKFIDVVNSLDIKTLKPLVRLHPRQKDLVYENIDMDTVNNMWELECINTITDKHILVSFFSTVQFSPKMIANKQPYVIFLYKLFLSNLDGLEIPGFEEMIQQLKDKYDDSSKIFVPENIEEFKQIIERLQNENK